MSKIGVIKDFRGSWGSGMATLVFEDGTEVPCENAPTVRAFMRAFGASASPGHTFDVRQIRGKKIEYWLDDMGLALAGFRPLDEETENED